jgi:hypothetical protein
VRLASSLGMVIVVLAWRIRVTTTRRLRSSSRTRRDGRHGMSVTPARIRWRLMRAPQRSRQPCIRRQLQCRLHARHHTEQPEQTCRGFQFWLSRGFDTSRHPDGRYVLEVEVSETRRRRDKSEGYVASGDIGLVTSTNNKPKSLDVSFAKRAAAADGIIEDTRRSVTRGERSKRS